MLVGGFSHARDQLFLHANWPRAKRDKYDETYTVNAPNVHAVPAHSGPGIDFVDQVCVPLVTE